MANNHSKYAIIRVTPVLSTDAYAAGDVLFVPTEIPNAVKGNGGCSKLVAMYLLNQNLTDIDIDLIFSENTGTIGTINATADIADGDLEAMNITGFVHLDASIGTTAGLDNAEIKRAIDVGTGDQGTAATPILIQAASNSTSVYVSGVIIGGTPTLAADDIDLIFHIEQK